MRTLVTLFGEGRFDQVLSRARAMLEETPASPDLRNIEGAALRALGRLDEAAAAFEAAAALAPASPQVRHNLAGVYRQLGRLEDSAASYAQVVALKPNDAEALNNLGAALDALGQVEAAAERFAQAAAADPAYAPAFSNLGAAFKSLGRLDEAEAAFRRAVALQPTLAEAHNNLGNTLKDLGRLDEAVDAYGAALAIRPSYASALAQRLNQQAHMCDFAAIAAAAPVIPRLGVEGAPVPPFAMLPLEDAPQRHLIRSRRYAAAQFAAIAPMPPPPRPAARPARLKVGYLSADFHNHASMFLMAQMFELHDRARFETHAYSVGPDVDDPMRRRAVAAFDAFHPVRDLDDAAIAALMRAHGLDIAVDLKGYTIKGRTGVLARRPAPVQINYMGYPGTLGTDFIDYVVTDGFVLPPGAESAYVEQPARLPHSYFVNDRSRVIADRAFTRAELGLPQEGFVFCCFNNNYKIGRPEFDIWMRLLNQVDGAVLWLLAVNPWAKANLQAQAAMRGVDPARIVFAGKLPHAQHLARHRCADLFLDTFHYNAHTTACDALWAGLPLVTKAGVGVPARVAGGVLTAVGLPDLITTTDDDYEALALALARDPARLAAIKARLAANRLTTPLFDTAAFTRAIEAVFDQAHQRWRDGLPPAPIAIAANS